MVVCPFAWAIITTKSPAVVPAGAETERAVPVVESFLLDALTATAILLFLLLEFSYCFFIPPWNRRKLLYKP